MGRAAATKLYRTFTKGLITEAGYLTYPEDSSTDELNTVIKPKGSRSRRLGIDYEPDSTAYTISGLSEVATVSPFPWFAVGNDSEVNFLVVQVAGTLHFFDMSSEPLSAGVKSFTINLLDYKTDAATFEQVRTSKSHMASGKGFLFVANEYIEPLVIEYDADTDTVEATRIRIQIRDFDGVDDTLGNEEQPATLSKEHLYNLKNQGWHQPYTTVSTGGGGSLDTGEVRVVNPYTGNRKQHDL